MKSAIILFIFLFTLFGKVLAYTLDYAYVVDFAQAVEKLYIKFTVVCVVFYGNPVVICNAIATKKSKLYLERFLRKKHNLKQNKSGEKTMKKFI